MDIEKKEGIFLGDGSSNHIIGAPQPVANSNLKVAAL